MNGINLSIAISIASMAAALIAFMVIGDPWVSAAVIAGILTLGAIIGHAAYNRFTDHETRRRDLEDRVRNPPL